MATLYTGRGAWSSKGGTLKFDRALNKTVPGPYYMAPVNSEMMGAKVYRQLQAGQTPDLNEYAVFLAVKELQKRLNDTLSAKLVVDGLLGPKTDAIIKNYQTSAGLYVDGIIGAATSTKLFAPEVKKVCEPLVVDWTVVLGLLHTESLFDAGAVGVMDSGDLGLAQINGPANPTFSVESRFNADVAIQYAAIRLNSALVTFSGNIRDAVASYNLGEGGCKTWIRAGRPDFWQPAGSTSPRNVKKYIDGIVDFYKTL